jgi:hypothetical protein
MLMDVVAADVLRGPGELDGAARRAAFAGGRSGEGGELAGALGALVAQVVRDASAVTDDDVARAVAETSEDAVFEAIAAAAVGAGMARFDHGMRALEGG